MRRTSEIAGLIACLIRGSIIGMTALLALSTLGPSAHAEPPAAPELPRFAPPRIDPFSITPPEPGSWAWLLDLSSPAHLVVDLEAWQRLLGPVARDPVERPVLAELLDGYRRRMVDAVDRYESTVAPGIDRAERREWYRENRGKDPSLAQPSANALRALHREELAALEALAVDTVDLVLGRAAETPGTAIVLVLRDGGEPPRPIVAPVDAAERAHLVSRVRDELIITARLNYLGPFVTSGIAGVGEKLDVLLEFDAFLDRHARLALSAAPGAPPSTVVSLDEICRHLSPHRADLARHHLAWRDAVANVRRSSYDDSVDSAREWRAVRRSKLEVGLVNDRLAQQVATALRTLCVDGETAARVWLREWRVRASDESVPVADAFETALAWVEVTDAVATEAGRAALRELRREHERRRVAHDEAIMRARFERLRCTSRTDDPEECPRDGIVAAETALAEAARRRLGDLRGLITSPELAEMFERRNAARLRRLRSE